MVSYRSLVVQRILGASWISSSLWICGAAPKVEALYYANVTVVVNEKNTGTGVVKFNSLRLLLLSLFIGISGGIRGFWRIYTA